MLGLECRFARNAPGLDGTDFQRESQAPFIEHCHPLAQLVVGELPVKIVIGVAYDVDSRSCLFPQIGLGKEFAKAASTPIGRGHHPDLRLGRACLNL